jgi:hypothetical protein
MRRLGSSEAALVVAGVVASCASTGAAIGD